MLPAFMMEIAWRLLALHGLTAPFVRYVGLQGHTTSVSAKAKRTGGLLHRPVVFIPVWRQGA